MKKIVAVISAAALCAVCAPALSGCKSGGIKFTLSEEGGKHYIVSFSGLSSPDGEYEIPAYYGEGESYAPVTEIANEGFANTYYSKIIVPATVTKIGNAAFSYCPALRTVEFAEGIELEEFSHGMFGASSYLQEINIPDSVKTIGGLAFYGCSSLSSVKMSGVETIGYSAFEECTALEQITLPSTLITIGSWAFYNSGLKSVEIPDSVKNIAAGDDVNEKTVYGLGYAAFNSCTNLESVKIGRGVTVIPSGAFYNCISLKEIYIPLSVTEVQGAYYSGSSFVCGHAFFYCNALKDVYYEGNEDDWKNIKIETQEKYESGLTMSNSAFTGATRHYNCS